LPNYQPHRTQEPFHLAMAKHNTTPTSSIASEFRHISLSGTTTKTTGRVQKVCPQFFSIYVLTIGGKTLGGGVAPSSLILVCLCFYVRSLLLHSSTLIRLTPLSPSFISKEPVQQKVGNVTGNLPLYLSKPVPVVAGMGFGGYRYGFSQTRGKLLKYILCTVLYT
jgi:hypothetical protein